MDLEKSRHRGAEKLLIKLCLLIFFAGIYTVSSVVYANLTHSNIVYADGNVNKGDVQISSQNTADSSKTGYVIRSSTVPNTAYSTMYGDSGSPANLYYGISEKSTTTGKLMAYLIRSGGVTPITSINPSAKIPSVLSGVVKSGQVTLHKGTDGFYYDKKGKSRQAYYAWTAKLYDSGAITNEDVTYFVKVMTVDNKNAPNKNVRANIVVKKDSDSASISEIKTSTYANVGDVPNTSTLLAEIFYTYGGTDGKAIKEANILYSNIRRYPNPSDKLRRNSELYKKENQTVTYYGDSLGAYIPNQLTLSSSNTTQGNTLANMLMIYGGWGFLQVDSTATKMNATSNNSFGNVVGELWNFGSGFMQVGTNIVLVIISPILWIIALIFDKINGILNLLIEVILYGVELIGNPLALGGLVGGQNVTAPNWLAEILGGLREQIVSNYTAETILSDTFNVLKWIVGIVSVILITLFIFNLTFRRKNNFRILTTWVFRFTAWFPLIVIAIAIGGLGADSKLGVQSSIDANRDSIDMLKFMVATNGDLSKVYTDNGKVSQIIGTNSVNLDDFSLSVKDIETVNAYIDQVLGSQLSEALSVQSTANTATFDVNDYLEAIKLASSLSNEKRSLIPANQLPSELTLKWNFNYVQATGSPMLFVEGDTSRQSANLIPNGYVWSGKVYMFTEQNGSGKKTDFDEEDSTKYVRTTILGDDDKSNKDYAIPYNASYWSATPVSLERPWTYLYGANQNNNSITENPQTYYFGANNPLINNLKESVKNSGDIEEDDNTAETITNADIYTENEILLRSKKNDAKIKHYWKYTNAYTLALINKYQGTNSLQNNSLQLSNQSVVFLLQSNLGETGLDYFATNTNFANDSKGKSGSATAFKYKRMVRPQKVDWLASQQISGAFQTFALTMLLVAFVKRIATMSVGDYIIGRYSAVSKAIFSGSWSNAIYYNVLTFFWVIIAKYIPISFTLSLGALNKVSEYSSQNDTLGELGAIGIGVTTLVISWVFTKKFQTKSGLQFSIVSSVVDLIDSIRFGIQSLLFGKYGPDALIYGANSGIGELFNGLTGNSEAGDRISLRNTNSSEDDTPTKVNETNDEKEPTSGDEEDTSSDNEGHNNSREIPDGGKRHSRFDKLKKGADKAIGGLGTLTPWLKVAGGVAKATSAGFKAFSRMTGVSDLTNSVVSAGNKYLPNGLHTAGKYVKYKGGSILQKGIKNTGKKLNQMFKTKPKHKDNDAQFTKKKTTPQVGDKNQKSDKKLNKNNNPKRLGATYDERRNGGKGEVKVKKNKTKPQNRPNKTQPSAKYHKRKMNKKYIKHKELVASKVIKKSPEEV